MPKTKTPAAAGRPPGFTGFGAGLIPFFAELAENQSRDWFLANRPRYDRDVHVPLESLVTSLSLALAARDIPLHGSPKASIFRINRDVRFSRDKTPYKTHASAVLTRTGDKHSQGLLYVHAGLGRSFMAAGFHALEPDQLAAMRDAMRARPVAWREIVAGLASASLELSRDTMAARMPRGYDAAELGDLAEWFRLRSFVVARDIAPDALAGPALVDEIAAFAGTALPFLRFGWKALGTLPPRQEPRAGRRAA